MAPMNAASKTVEQLASNRRALEAEGTGGTDESDSTALFSNWLASALGVEVGAAGVAENPRESYDFGSAVMLAGTVYNVVNPLSS